MEVGLPELEELEDVGLYDVVELWAGVVVVVG